tara:strand:+ start:219 stop:668 length:450 start_codon:yes stop_codon:yes gene_type:complete
MNIRIIFQTFIFILIPFYIFVDPITEYMRDSNKVTYTMNIPSQSNMSENNIDNMEFDEIDIRSFPKIEKTFVESWVITYPEINKNKDKELFIVKLESIGINSFFYVKKNKKSPKIISIGPYVDKSMAISMKEKVNQLIKYEGKIIRIGN